jgi:hypothetical protein
LVNELTKKYKPEMLIKSDGCYSVWYAGRWSKKQNWKKN